MDAPTLPNDWIRTSEAAELIGVSPRRVLQFVREGRIRSLLVNPKCRLVRAADVHRLAAAERRSGRPSA